MVFGEKGVTVLLEFCHHFCAFFLLVLLKHVVYVRGYVLSMIFLRICIRFLTYASLFFISVVGIIASMASILIIAAL